MMSVLKQELDNKTQECDTLKEASIEQENTIHDLADSLGQ